nr:uncharacterized protein LOC109174175 [Ipomoea trifida]
MVKKRNNGLIKLETKLRKELDDVLHEEEIYWYQRSREQWIASGDRNTKYYHLAAKIKRSRNTCKSLLNDDGLRIYDEEILKNMVKDFYTKLFAKDDQQEQKLCTRNAFPKISEEDWNNIYTISSPLLNKTHASNVVLLAS